MSKSKTRRLKNESQPMRLERTGEKRFRVEHDDGSVFEGTIDPHKVRFAEDSRKTASRFHIPGGKVALRNVMSNADRRKMGVSQDPSLPDYQE